MTPSDKHSACPDEDLVPDGVPGKVEDHEVVIRVAVLSDWLMTDTGRTTLSTAAFPKSHLSGQKGASVSLLRKKTSAGEISKRALA